MGFLRTLLNSGVFMIVLLAAATLYLVYSDSIKREHGVATDEAATPVANAVVAPAPVAAEVAPTPAPVVAEAPIQAEPAFETQPPQQAEESTNAAMPEMPPMPMMPQDQQQAMPEMPPMPMMPQDQQQAMPEMPPMPMMPQDQQQAMPMQQESHVSSNVDAARAALYEGNLDVAAQAYQVELANNNDPDLHGELGNVYFAQQDWQHAGIEYAAAIEGLSAQGRFLQAQYVLGFLMQINPDMGEQSMKALRAQMYPHTTP
jgi:tetratricopeptide (TPR) repeat protein